MSAPSSPSGLRCWAPGPRSPRWCGRMRLVGAGLQEERRAAVLDEVAGDGEHEIGAEHVLAEGIDGRLRDRGIAGAHRLAVALYGGVPAVAVLPQADRVLQHRRGDPVRRLLDRLEAVAAADAAAHDVELLEAEMVDQRQMVGGEGVPAMVGLDVGHRLAGVALVHGDHRVLVGERDARIHPREAVGIVGRYTAPHLDPRGEPARRIEQDGKARTMDLVVDLGIGALQHRHVCLLVLSRGYCGGL